MKNRLPSPPPTGLAARSTRPFSRLGAMLLIAAIAALCSAMGHAVANPLAGPVSAVQQAGTENVAGNVIEKTGPLPFKAAYRRALGAKASNAWLAAGLREPPTTGLQVTIVGATYRIASLCKPQACDGNNIVVFYAPASGAVYGRLLIDNVLSLLGAPPPEVAVELDRVWHAEWRPGE